jgi:hypothetical protein
VYVDTQGGGFLKLERFINGIKLQIGEGSSISFQKEWAEQLRALPYEEFGSFMRDTIYPALSEEERKTWNSTKISNKDLQLAIEDFK